jgi:hypothetical protein
VVWWKEKEMGESDGERAGEEERARGVEAGTNYVIGD